MLRQSGTASVRWGSPFLFKGRVSNFHDAGPGFNGFGKRFDAHVMLRVLQADHNNLFGGFYRCSIFSQEKRAIMVKERV